MATMTSTSALPHTPRPPPPSGPLPALPVPKSRTRSVDDRDSTAPTPSPRTSTSSQLPTSTPKRTAIPSRAVTLSAFPAKSHSTPSVPRLSTVPSDGFIPSPSPPTTASALPKTVRKTTSIGSFPLPPQVSSRVTSLPPSPLSASTSPNEANAQAQAQTSAKRDSSKHRSVESGLRKVKSRSSGYGLRARASNSGLGAMPSALSGTEYISRNSDSLLSIPSPPDSRSSSANGSYQTDMTELDDHGDRGRSRKSSSSIAAKRTSEGKDKDMKGNVLVSVRVRPDAGSDEERTEGEWMVDGRRSLISYRGREGGDYRYDNVFSPHDNNSRVYDSAAKRLVKRVMEGYDGTVFAYGMTGTGKTFSMQGTANSPGVIPLAITDIFSYIRENPSREFLLRVSYLEIYNEKIFDLLSQAAPGQPQEEIKLREDAKRGVYATPLKEEIVQSPNQLLRVIARGDVARRTSSTQYNARSSRSHAVVQIVVESRERTQSHGAYFEKEARRVDKILPGGVLVSTLSLIDLAGSEKAAESKERRTEGAHINKSLLTLGTVIARLSGEDDKEEKDGAKSVEREKGMKHLPYRDSKLTRLLQSALSGNSLVSILCTIQLSSANTSAAQANGHTGETLNTLKFASRAKNNIVSHAKRNESNLTGDASSRALLDRYRIEIQDLRAQLEQQTMAKDESEKQEEIEKDRQIEEQLEREEKVRHEEQMLEMQLARTALKERISHLNRLILSSRSIGVNSGRFSTTSMPFDPRMSSVSATPSEYGRPVSVRSRESSHRDSDATIDAFPTDVSSGRTMSGGSVTMGSIPAAQVSSLVTEDEPAIEDDEGGDSAGADGEGHATLTQQNRMLQADLADKNRYIATLEKRLLQARRTSHSRVSTTFASRVDEEGSPEALLLARDREIEQLRIQLDDQVRMVTALRSAARKREMAERRKSHQTATSDDTARPSTSRSLLDSVPDLSTLPFNRNSSRASRQSIRSTTMSLRRQSSHHSTPSNASRSSGGAVNPSQTPLSPMAILSPAHSSSNSRESIGLNGERIVKSAMKTARRRSVDEMTALLDSLIQDKVESGRIVRGDKGSLRVRDRHDTILQQAAQENVTPVAELDEPIDELKPTATL